MFHISSRQTGECSNYLCGRKMPLYILLHKGGHFKFVFQCFTLWGGVQKGRLFKIKTEEGGKRCLATWRRLGGQNLGKRRQLLSERDRARGTVTTRDASAHNETVSPVTHVSCEQELGHVTYVSRSDFVRLLYVAKTTVRLTSEGNGWLIFRPYYPPQKLIKALTVTWKRAFSENKRFLV